MEKGDGGKSFASMTKRDTLVANRQAVAEVVPEKLKKQEAVKRPKAKLTDVATKTAAPSQADVSDTRVAKQKKIGDSKRSNSVADPSNAHAPAATLPDTSLHL